MQPGDLPLILLALAAVGGLVVLVTRAQVHAFLALLAAALAVGIGAGWIRPGAFGLAAALQSVKTGLGATLGGITVILGLGALLGAILAGSGGASVVAGRLVRAFGPARVPAALLVLGVLVGLATWFAVGLVLLAPVLLGVAARPGAAPLRVILPVLAALSLAHGLMPPHPGPQVALNALGADPGRVLLWGAAVGLPVLVVTGPLLARWLAPRVAFTPAPPPASSAASTPVPTPGTRPPGFAVTLVALLLPVGLMLLATVTELLLGPEAPLARAAALAGHPTLALLAAVAWATWALGLRTGHGGAGLRRWTGEGLGTVGTTLLVVGAGGAFAQVLRDAGVADALGRAASGARLPPLLYGWLLAVAVRVATGSATVAITTAAGLLAPVLALHPEYTPGQRALFVVVLGSGSLCLSHLNDGGFWIVKDSLGLDVGTTLRTWTVCETLIGLLGLALAALYFPLAAA